MPPHNMVLCMVGTGMLWVGWYGFNAGSAVAADGIAANAFMTTTLATAVASFTWAMAEYDLPRQAEHPGLLLRRGGGPGGHYAGLRLRDDDRRGHHRRGGGADPLPGLLEAQVGCGL